LWRIQLVFPLFQIRLVLFRDLVSARLERDHQPVFIVKLLVLKPQPCARQALLEVLLAPDEVRKPLVGISGYIRLRGIGPPNSPPQHQVLQLVDEIAEE
jgi:hypothetical protein